MGGCVKARVRPQGRWERSSDGRGGSKRHPSVLRKNSSVVYSPHSASGCLCRTSSPNVPFEFGLRAFLYRAVEKSVQLEPRVDFQGAARPRQCATTICSHRLTCPSAFDRLLRVTSRARFGVPIGTLTTRGPSAIAPDMFVPRHTHFYRWRAQSMDMERDWSLRPRSGELSPSVDCSSTSGSYARK